MEKTSENLTGVGYPKSRVFRPIQSGLTWPEFALLVALIGLVVGFFIGLIVGVVLWSSEGVVR